MIQHEMESIRVDEKRLASARLLEQKGGNGRKATGGVKETLQRETTCTSVCYLKPL